MPQNSITAVRRATLLRCIIFSGRMPGLGLVSRETPVHTAMRNCTRDEGRPFEVGNQVLISNHRKLLCVQKAWW
jgi:hypothetical protein